MINIACTLQYRCIQLILVIKYIYLQRKSKKGRRVVAREIDFDGDNEVSVSEDFLSSTSYTSEIFVYPLNVSLVNTKSCNLWLILFWKPTIHRLLLRSDWLTTKKSAPFCNSWCWPKRSHPLGMRILDARDDLNNTVHC